MQRDPYPSAEHLLAVAGHSQQLAYFLLNYFPLAGHHPARSPVGFTVAQAAMNARAAGALLTPSPSPSAAAGSDGCSSWAPTVCGWHSTVAAAYLELRNAFDLVVGHYQWGPWCEGRGVMALLGSGDVSPEAVLANGEPIRFGLPAFAPIDPGLPAELHRHAATLAALLAPPVDPAPPAKRPAVPPAAPATPEPTLLLPTPLSAADLAARLGRDPKAVDTFLRRLVKKRPGCRMTVDCPRRNQPRYLYLTAAVWPPLKQWANKQTPPTNE